MLFPLFICSVDGGWTSWSSWFVCEQLTGEKCQCRTRTCTQPSPQHGGKLCQGSNVEITRCEGYINTSIKIFLII